MMGVTGTKNMVLLKTFSLVILWVVFGMSVYIYPATLPDLTKRFQTDQEGMAFAFLAGSLGNIVGGPSTFIVDRFYSHVDLIIGGSLIMNGVILIMKPLYPSLVVLGLFNFVEHILMMILASGGNTMLLALWGEKSGPPMQALHFGFPLGAMLGPLLAYPYVSNSDNEHMQRSADSIYPDGSQIEKVFSIIGMIIISVGTLFAFYHFAKMPTVGEGVPRKSQAGLSWKQMVSPNQWSPGRPEFGVKMFIFMCLFYILHLATMRAAIMYHALYAVETNMISKQESTVLSFSFHFSGTVSRAINIVLSNYVSVRKLVLIFAFGEILTAFCMPFVSLHDIQIYWISCCIFGFFKEPLWPCMMTWMNQYIELLALIVGMSGAVISIGDAFIGWTFGYVYANIGKESAYYISAVFSIVFCILIITMNKYANLHGVRFKTEVKRVTTKDF